MNFYRVYMRRKLLEDIYDNLSEEDKRSFVQMTFEDKGWKEIAQTLQRQESKIDDVSRRIGKHPFASDLIANLSGSAIWDSLVWIGKKIIRKF